MSEIKFAVVVTWPWGVKNAESEVINRMKFAAANIGAELVCITKEGFIVNEDFRKTEKKVDVNSLDFVITLHYEDIKLQDVFYYHTLWNPPKITLQYPLYHVYAKNIASNDDFLIYDDGGMSDHLKSILSDKPRVLEGASSLTASFSEKAILTPYIPEKPILFYCGMNWERFIGAESRHAGLFGLLDNYDDVNFYGPDHSWDGYSRYKGSIPFDGVSLIEEIHKCGVVLALSSDYHYRAGAATNRIYEACAGGAVTISDTNRFIMRHFGDSVLYIDYDKENPKKMFEQIRHHLDWIKKNPDEALKKAQKAQKIFVEKFALEKQLRDIIANHENRKKCVEEALYAKNNEAKLLALLFLDVKSVSENEIWILNNAIDNIRKQIYSNITLVVCCSLEIKDELTAYVKTSGIDVRLVPFEFFDKCGNKLYSRCQAFRSFINDIPHDYLMFLDGSENMFSNHVSTLIRTFEDYRDAKIVYSGDFLDAEDSMRYPLLRENIHKQDFYKGFYPSFYPHTAGMFLFRADVEGVLPEEAEQYLDTCLPNAFINLAVFKHNCKTKYSEMITIGKIQSIDIEFPVVLTRSQEINFVQGLVLSEYEEWQASFPNHVSLEDGGFAKEVDRHIKKVQYRRFRKKLVAAIILNYMRFLVVYNKDKRQKIDAKIKKLKEEYRQTMY